MRVLDFYASNNISGPGKGLLQLATHAKKSGCEFTVCNFRHPQQETFEFLEAAQELDVDIQLITQRWALDPLMLREAVQIAKSKDYDIVQSHGYKTHLIARYVSRKLGIPWVAVAHGWTDENLKIRLYNQLEKFLLRLAPAVIAVAPQLHARICEFRKTRRTAMILNAIDPAEYPASDMRESTRNELGVTAEHTVFGVLGRLSREKGQDQFIEAFSRVAAADKVAVIVGEGPARKRLEQQASDMGLGQRIRFVGYQTEIYRFFQAIDIVVLPSRSEGLPNVVLEAQLFERPVVAFDVGGVSETIAKGETGWLVPPGDIDGLTAAMLEAADDRERRQCVTENATTRLFPKFSVERRVQSFIDEYRRLIDAVPSGGPL
jgi:glycosyltransferase involved in cell wall biosynthesis